MAIKKVTRLVGSRWLPLSEVVEQAAALPRGDAIVVYCT